MNAWLKRCVFNLDLSAESVRRVCAENSPLPPLVLSSSPLPPLVPSSSPWPLLVPSSSPWPPLVPSRSPLPPLVPSSSFSSPLVPSSSPSTLPECTPGSNPPIQILGGATHHGLRSGHLSRLIRLGRLSPLICQGRPVRSPLALESRYAETSTPKSPPTKVECC